MGGDGPAGGRGGVDGAEWGQRRSGHSLRSSQYC